MVKLGVEFREYLKKNPKIIPEVPIDCPKVATATNELKKQLGLTDSEIILIFYILLESYA